MERLPPPRCGEFDEPDGDPFDTLWNLRQFYIEVTGHEPPDDTLPDEPLRRVVAEDLVP